MRKKMGPSANAMQELLIGYFGEKYRNYVTISINWDNIVGDYLAKYCRAERLDKNTLFVGVENSAIMQELVLFRNDIIKKITRTLSIGLKDIIFFISNDEFYVGHR